SETATLIGGEADRRVDRLAEDRLRRPGRNLLDLDPTLRRGHDGDPAARPIDHYAEVELACDRTALLDEQPPHHPPLRARLMGDQRLSEQRLGRRARLDGVLHELDATRLAATARVDLRLPDARAAGSIGRGDRLVDGGTRPA